MAESVAQRLFKRYIYRIRAAFRGNRRHYQQASQGDIRTTEAAPDLNPLGFRFILSEKLDLSIFIRLC